MLQYRAEVESLREAAQTFRPNQFGHPITAKMKAGFCVAARRASASFVNVITRKAPPPPARRGLAALW